MTGRQELASVLAELLFEEPGVGRCLVAPDGTVLRANAEWLRSAGFALDDVLGANIVDLFPGTRDRAVAMHAQARAGHRVEVPRHARAVNGRETWWEGTIEPVPMEGGRGLLITARQVDPANRIGFDITDRKRMIEESERYSDLLRLSQEAILVWNFESGIELWSRGAEALYGFTAEEARGRVSHELLRTALPSSRPEFEELLRDQRQWEGEIVHTTRDAHQVAVWARLQVIRGGDGVDRVFESNRDITERKAATARQAYLASFPEKNPIPIMEADEQGRVRYANPAALRLFPDLHEKGGEHPWLSGWVEVVRELRDGKASGSSRTVAVGDRSFLQQFAYLANDRVVRAYGIDVTEQNRAEETLREANEKLREADRLKDEFLSAASHELRTPITTLSLQTQGLLRTLSRGGLDEARVRSKLTSMEGQLARLNRLVDTLLDVSRMLRGRLHLEREPCDLGHLASEAVERFEEAAERGGTSFRLRTSPATGVWDRLRLEQVLTNLLDNVVKYAPGSAVHVTVESEDGEAVLRVRDHGPGISPESQTRIFQQYERAVDTNVFGGLGLGLWITRQIAEAHGGSISVESELGRGATFTVRLPTETE
ncbi:MAG TPA: ATP-binding protein [Anaeromyxobacteraceae bacterium]|nr:ATP-binding protein [Anaeromyxobacteraceae bacterium]